jgi:hypothetical protein
VSEPLACLVRGRPTFPGGASAEPYPRRGHRHTAVLVDELDSLTPPTTAYILSIILGSFYIRVLCLPEESSFGGTASGSSPEALGLLSL